MKVCPDCSAENLDDVAFCQQCGAVFIAGEEGEGVSASASASAPSEAHASASAHDLSEARVLSGSAVSNPAKTEILDKIPPVVIVPTVPEVSSTKQAGPRVQVPEVVKVPVIKPSREFTIEEQRARLAQHDLEKRLGIEGEAAKPSVADLVTSLPETPAGPDLSGFERLVDSSYVPPAPVQVGDTAEFPRIEEEYVPRAKTYAVSLTAKELKKREREQKRFEKKLARQQEKEEARRAKELLKADRERWRAELEAQAASVAVSEDEATPASYEKVVEETGPVFDGTAVDSAAPVTDTTTVNNAAPVTDTTTVNNTTPATDASGVDNTTLTSDASDAGEEAPSADETPEAEAQAVVEPAVDETATAASVPKEKTPATKAIAEKPAITPAKTSSFALKKAYLIGALIAIVLVVAGVAFGTYSAELWGGKTIPAVQGLTLDEATKALEEKGFAVQDAYEKSDEDAGTVLGSDPASGARAAEGSTITLNIAQARVMPQVIGKTKEEAQSLLGAEGFTNVGFKEEKSNETEGTVITCSPTPGDVLKAADAIELTLAIPYTVPDVTGLTQEKAEAALKEAGYKVSVETKVTDEAKEGTALSTNPEAGTKLNSGKTVTVYIAKSRGAELVELTESILPGATLTVDEKTYQVESVSSCTYRADGEVLYTVKAKEYEIVTLPFGLGEQTYYRGSATTLEGSIVWNDNNEVSYASPSIRY
jgi:serine/threonine-protein kinase